MGSFTLGTKKIVPPAVKQQKKIEAKAKEAKEKALHKRRKESEALLFGSELFEPIAKKEKEIVIHFPENCTNAGIYISKCGKFGYQHAQSGFFFNLFYFIDAVLDWSVDLTIVPSENIWLFDNLTPEELEDLAIRLKRAEYAEEKKKALEEIKEIERQRREELDEADKEFEAAQENNAEEFSIEELHEGMKEIIQPIGMQNEPEKLEMLPFEATLEEVSAIEAKIKQATEEIKPKIKPAFIPLQFGKVNKK